jgi:hypothetical protein
MTALLYILLFIGWAGAALLLGRFVRGAGFSPQGHFFSGLWIIFAFYLLGICLLFLAILLG